MKNFMFLVLIIVVLFASTLFGEETNQQMFHENLQMRTEAKYDLSSEDVQSGSANVPLTWSKLISIDIVRKHPFVLLRAKTG